MVPIKTYANILYFTPPHYIYTAQFAAILHLLCYFQNTDPEYLNSHLFKTLFYDFLRYSSLNLNIPKLYFVYII